MAEAKKKAAAQEAPAVDPSPQAPAKTSKALSVQSSREGFRRAGRAWSREATVVPLADLTEDQIEQLRNEPALTVVEIEMGE